MGRRGMSKDLPHIDRFRDRHGKERLYYRRQGGPRTPLPPADDPGFLEAYTAASAGQKAPKARGGAGTFDRMIAAYYRSSDFKRCKPSTQKQRRSVLDQFCEKHGHRIVKQATPAKLKSIFGGMADTPSQANQTLKLLRMVIRAAISDGELERDPTLGIRRYKEGTYHTWTEEEIAQFEERWPVGTRERTAFALHLYTGQRMGDVCGMTWRDYDAKAGTIRVAQTKTGAKLSIPVHGRLRAALEAHTRSQVMILPTAYGKGFTVNGFGGWMADIIGEAKLPDRCVTHGIRKAAARRLAEVGCSAMEIMSITGHKSLKEAERYVREADQATRAKAAVLKLEEHFPE